MLTTAYGIKARAIFNMFMGQQVFQLGYSPCIFSASVPQDAHCFYTLHTRCFFWLGASPISFRAYRLGRDKFER